MELLECVQIAEGVLLFVTARPKAGRNVILGMHAEC